MDSRIYYVVQNRYGKFFNYDSNSGGHPFFTENFEACYRFKSLEEVKSFLSISDYCVRMFPHEFEGCSIKKLCLTIEDCL